LIQQYREIFVIQDGDIFRVLKQDDPTPDLLDQNNHEKRVIETCKSLREALTKARNERASCLIKGRCDYDPVSSSKSS
jgi:hypothetical protein